MARIKCSVCGLYRGEKPHTGAMHDRIRANRDRLKKGLLGGSRLSRKLGRRG